MKEIIQKRNLIKLILLLFSELICFEITRINLFSYSDNAIYVSSMNLVQILYFLPVLFITLYFFMSTKSDKQLLTNSTITLILYTIILHIFIVPIASFFTNRQGTINFTEYASKIYFISLPLAHISILLIKKETMKKSYLLLIFKIILLTFITFIFSKLFALKGVLYAWPLSELINVLILFIIHKKCTLIK